MAAPRRPGTLAAWTARSPWLAALALGALPAAVRPSSAHQADPQEAGAEGVVAIRLEREGSLGRSELSCALALQRARAAGADRVYLTASDPLLDPRRQVSRWSLDGPQEPVDAGESWTVQAGLERSRSKRVSVETPRRLTRSERVLGPDGLEALHAFDTEASRDGSPSLRLSMSGSNTEDFRRYDATLSAEQARHQRPLVPGLTARLHVLPESIAQDGRPFAEFTLSRQVVDGALRTDRLHYYLTDAAGEPYMEGNTAYIPVACEVGAWNELTLELARDAERVAGTSDTALVRMVLGLESRFQAPCAARFDQFELTAPEAGPDEALELAGAVLEDAASRIGVGARLGMLHEGLRRASVLQLGESPSLLEHALLTGQDDGAEPPRPERLLAELVEAIESSGAVAVLDNVLAAPHHRVEARDKRVAELIEQRLFGAETVLLEADPSTLDDQVAAWDAFAAAGLYPAVVGYGGEWLDRHALVSGIFSLSCFVPVGPTATGASGPSGAELALDDGRLLEGLAAGRATVGDPAAHGGALELVSARGFRMGQVVLTDRGAAQVQLELLGAPPEDEVSTFSWVTSAGVYSSLDLDGRRPLTLGELPDYVRVELLGSRARAVAYSNALHFVRAWPEGGLPAPRAAFDLAGVRCLDGAGVRLTQATVEASGAPLRIRIAASTRRPGGRLELLLEREAPARVRFEGLEGRAQQAGLRLRLLDLDGAGSIVLTQ